MDEPFGDSSALPVHILSMHTRKHATVALSGDGADELFGGYNKHAAEYRVRQKGLAAQLVKLGNPLWNNLPKSRNSKLSNKIRQLKKFSEGMKLNEQERYWRWASVANENEAKKIFATDYHNFNQEYSERKKEILKYINDDFNAVLYTDMKLVLQNDMLTKVDLMSMANGLEVRLPFLDYHLVHFAFSLPAEFKIDGKRRKKILKDAFRNYLPEELYTRHKQGFEVPLLKWFRTELKSMLMDDLLNEKFILEQNIFNADEIKKLKSKLFSTNPEESVAQVWGLIVFQHWWKKYFSK